MDIRKRELLKIIEELAKKLPKFADGRINYSDSDTAPVITVFLKYKGKILILKRSDKVSFYQRKWNTVAGYIDELKPIQEKITEEISEETGVKKEDILSHKIGKSYTFTDPLVNKTWIVIPAIVELKIKPKIKLDWEHTEYKWIKPEDLKKFDIVPKIDESLNRAIN